MKRFFRWLLAVFVLCAAGALYVYIFMYGSTPLMMERYAERHDVFTLSDVYRLKWGVAYNDPSSYSDGKYIRETYDLDFSAGSTVDGFQRRLYFFNNGRLVKTITYDLTEFKISDIEVITPDTVFCAKWENGHHSLTLSPLKAD